MSKTEQISENKSTIVPRKASIFSLETISPASTQELSTSAIEVNQSFQCSGWIRQILWQLHNCHGTNLDVSSCSSQPSKQIYTHQPWRRRSYGDDKQRVYWQWQWLIWGCWQGRWKPIQITIYSVTLDCGFSSTSSLHSNPYYIWQIFTSKLIASISTSSHRLSEQSANT